MLVKDLLEMQHYPSKSGVMQYQNIIKFKPISVRNVTEYTILGEDSAGFVYTVSPGKNFGYVFLKKDLTSGQQEASPVMHVSLRDTVFGSLKQAHNLRIKEEYSKASVATTWYDLYIRYVGGVVSDNEHLDGGKVLWASFKKKAGNQYKIQLANSQTGEILKDVVTNTPDQEIWSTDASLKHLVLICKPN